MDGEDLDSLQKQLLTCPVCLEDFHDDSQTVVLPCLHSLCESCIPKIVTDEQKLPCPVCRMVHPAGSFKTDTTTRDLADFVVVKKSPSVACEGKGCDETDVATHRCRPCGEFLCSECVTAHRRTTVTRDHQLVPIEELRDAADLQMFSHPQTCEIHNDKPLELYCNRKECQKPVCVTCAFVYHRTSDGHELTDVGEISRQRRAEIMQQLQAIKKKTDDVSKSIDNIADEKREIRSRHEYVSSEIEAVINTLHEQIDRMKKNLNEQLAKQVKQKCEHLDEQEAGLKQLKSNMEHAVLYSDKVVCHASIPSFLQLERTIAERLQCLEGESFDEEPWEIAAFGLDCQGISGEVQSALTQKMHIWASSIYPPNCKISQSKVANIGEQLVFNISMTTAYDHPVTEDVHFKANITDARGDTALVPVKNGGLHNGHFDIVYTPMVNGKHSLDLTIQNKTFASHNFQVGSPGDDEDIETVEEETPSKTPPATPDTQPVIEKRPLPPQMVSSSSAVFDRHRPMRFFLDKETAHKDVSVSEDGTTFVNSQQSAIPKNSINRQNRHKKFKGARGTHVFTKPGRYFYEVILEMKVISIIQQNNIAFEIGIARKSSIDNKKYIEGQPFAWSMIGSLHPSCNCVCIHVVRDRKVLLHKSLLKNEIDQECRIALGFIVDTDNGTWEIYNSEVGEELCVLPDVNCDEPLFPVVSGYNASQVQVTATFVTGHENIPEEI